MSRYGHLAVVGDSVEYQPGVVDAAVPPGPWSFRIESIDRVLEKTFPVGPVFDWFIVFDAAGVEYAVPTEAFEDAGLERVLREISDQLGRALNLRLANSVNLASEEIFRRG